jgi:CDP-diacylglycerol--serine O-phosphatidyltransferase
MQDPARKERQLIVRPDWLSRFEKALATRIVLGPNTLSAIKLFAVAPALWAALDQVGVLPGGAALVCALFGAFALLDYLDGLVARERGMATAFGRLFDRVTDYPLLIALSIHCAEVLPVALVALKLALDLLLLALYVAGRGSTQNRLRTALSYTTLFALLSLSQGWLPEIVRRETVSYLLFAGIAFSSVVALYNLDVLCKHRIADLLSLGNLGCGLLSIAAAWQGRFEASLVLLLLGAGFDGLDGAAARRWGSSKWGVYSDDLADAVNFAIAPAAVAAVAIGGAAGMVAGALFALLTLSRLLFFTLDKDRADPRYFAGVPSTVGGLIAITAAIVFRDQPALVGLAIGAACVWMVSFDARHRHLGRLLAEHRALLLSTPLALAALALAAALWGARGPAALLLALGVGYALVPTARRFAHAAARRAAAHGRGARVRGLQR